MPGAALGASGDGPARGPRPHLPPAGRPPARPGPPRPPPPPRAPGRARLGRGARLERALEEVLADPAVDAVIVASPLPERAAELRRALQSERHVLCAYPPDATPDAAYEAAM